MRRALIAVVTFTGLYGCYDYSLEAPQEPSPTDAKNGAPPAKNESETLTPKSVPAEEAASEPAGTPSSTPSSSSPDAGSPPVTPTCIAGQTYCGGGKIAGDKRSLYRCAADGQTGELVSACANGCVTNQPGEEDACSAPTKCVVGGTYCGGDKVNGDPGVLYKCTGGGFSAVVQTRCAKGCFVAPAGTDDRCN